MLWLCPPLTPAPASHPLLTPRLAGLPPCPVVLALSCPRQDCQMLGELQSAWCLLQLSQARHAAAQAASSAGGCLLAAGQLGPCRQPEAAQCHGEVSGVVAVKC